MRHQCFNCGQSVSSEVPEETVFRCVSYCPECVGQMAHSEHEQRKPMLIRDADGNIKKLLADDGAWRPMDQVPETGGIVEYLFSDGSIHFASAAPGSTLNTTGPDLYIVAWREAHPDWNR